MHNGSRHLRQLMTIHLKYLLFALFIGFSGHSYANNLINGGSVNGAIDIAGDIDTYQFTANQGEYVLISAVDINNSSLFPSIQVRDPSGNVVTSSTESRAARVRLFANSTGTFSITIRDNTPNTDEDTGIGAFRIHYVIAPGVNEHGRLVNGDFVTEEITLGDIDSWTLEAGVGEYVFLSAKKSA